MTTIQDLFNDKVFIVLDPDDNVIGLDRDSGGYPEPNIWHPSQIYFWSGLNLAEAWVEHWPEKNYRIVKVEVKIRELDKS